MTYLIQALFFLVITFFVVYAALEVRLVLLSRKAEKLGFEEVRAHSHMPDDASAWPVVTVLLPVYNESTVVERLIDAVCALEYPHDILQILVLDDSTDQTTELAAAKVVAYSDQGLDIDLIKRKKRTGYKAGNLANGLSHARGEFLVVFDADFLPPTEFLLKTLPCFVDPEVGYLQTGIGYHNADASFLTRFQAMMLGHQQYVTTGLSYEKLMGALSGSSCVWRRSCVDSLGGWCGKTLAEDADIGYRAQFSQWRYAYLREVVSYSELPESIDAIRIQRHRWGYGLIHNAFKHFRQFTQTGMGLMERLHAVSLIFSSLLLASIYGLVLLALPLAFMTGELDTLFDVVCSVFLLGALVWIGSNYLGSKKTSEIEDRPLLGRMAMMLGYVVMFFPLSLYYFYAGVQLLFSKDYEFKRTPKLGVIERDRLNKELSILEWLTLTYGLLSFGVAWYYKNYWLVLFDMLVCMGFGIVIYFQIIQQRCKPIGQA